LAKTVWLCYLRYIHTYIHTYCTYIWAVVSARGVTRVCQFNLGLDPSRIGAAATNSGLTEPPPYPLYVHADPVCRATTN